MPAGLQEYHAAALRRSPVVVRTRVSLAGKSRYAAGVSDVAHTVGWAAVRTLTSFTLEVDSCPDPKHCA